eukprot:TRINITY_DN3190_c0_g6_i1.p1 TRINITY_DN3190_c0_g6~~TRINITY_DN3190_c0_g6_i1.p1  ORF type:complete len:50 (-),score=8.47 TRINITY_DN3190_c0_g6_i1:354-503(-)
MTPIMKEIEDVIFQSTHLVCSCISNHPMLECKRNEKSVFNMRKRPDGYI